MNKIEFGDCRDIMRRWYDDGVKVQMCVTSPPYFGLRDYGVEGQFGAEKTPEEYVCAMVETFRAVRNLLNEDGVLWLNLGDSYNAAGRKGHGTRQGYKQATNRASSNGLDTCRPSVEWLKEKDLIGIPWMVALRSWSMVGIYVKTLFGQNPTPCQKAFVIVALNLTSIYFYCQSRLNITSIGSLCKNQV